MSVYALSAAAAQQLPLHDIVDVYTASWWPLAPGWWLLIGVLCGLLWASIWWGWRRWQQQRGKRRVEQLLLAPVSRISDVTLRLKQILLLKYSRPQLAQEFVSLLLSSLPPSQGAFEAEALRYHLERQFQDHEPDDAEAFQSWALKWWQHAYTQFKQEVRHV